MVCFIHRPEYYKIYQDEKGRDLHGKAEIIIAKHRNGAVGDVLLEFRGEFARFSDPDENRFVPAPGEQGGVIESKGLSAEEQERMMAQNPFGDSFPPPPTNNNVPPF
jgi:replicative DNA helicase